MTRDEVTRRLSAAGCVFAEDEADLLLSAATSEAELRSLVDSRVRGLPLEQVVGWADFCGVRVAVDPGVFVPRPRTELLVQEAAVLARALPAPATVVDLCCGCGAVGAALAARVPRMILHAADLDPAAVRCARRNLAGLGAAVYEGDLFAPLPANLKTRVGVLVANVPYVPTGAIALMPAEARLHEPRAALDGGSDGLAVLRRVAAGAPAWLAPGGAALMEVGEDQVEAALDALRSAGFGARVVHDGDLEATVVIGVG
jgi:release factor glutamine methyltransferase